MAKFKVNNTFYLKAKKYFIISGEIISGNISNDMFFAVKYYGRNIKFPIHEINYLQSRSNDQIKDEVALCILVDNETIVNLLKKNVKNGETHLIQLSEKTISPSLPVKADFRITSFPQNNVMNVKLVSGYFEHIVKLGCLYTFHVNNSNEELIGVYTKRDHEYFKVNLIDNQNIIKTGSILSSKPTLHHHEED
jgi:hypothetical protein